MDRNCSNLSKLPPKLRYFNGIERSSSKQMTNNVVRNIEDLLDELDSSPDTESELSPLSKAGNLSEDGENVSIPKLILETSDDVLCNVQESLSEDCAPKKMSTPVPLVAGGDDPDWDGDENHRGSPVLLESEDELPESDAIKTAQSDKKSQLAGKDFEESSEDELQIPPKKFVFENHPKSPTANRAQEQQKGFCSLSSDEEFLSLPCKKSVVPDTPSQKSKVSVQIRGAMTEVHKDEPSTAPPLEKNHKNTMISEGNVLKERQSSAFLLKLKDIGQSKSMSFRKEASPAQVSPLEADEDFMILEEENLKSPRWFTIPRKTEVKRNKPEQQETSEAEVKNNKEASTSEKAANDIHNQAQNKKIKRSRSKGAKEKKTNELGNVEQKMKRRRVNSVDKRPVDIPDSAQSVSMSDSPERLAEVSGHAETQSDEHGDELLPLPSKTSNQAEEPAVKKNKKPKRKQHNINPKESRKKSESETNGEERLPLSTCENIVTPEGLETGKRKRHEPGSWWLVCKEKQTDMCNNNEVHVSVAKKKPKKTKQAPAEPIPSSAAEQAVAHINRVQQKLPYNHKAEKKTQISKTKSKSNRGTQKSRKTESQVPGLPQESEEGGMNGAGEDHECCPSPPSQKHALTSDKKQKKSKGKQPNNGGGTDMPHSVQENGAPLEHHETGRRKRKKPGSWWLVNQDEQTDMCNNELHSSGTNRRKKANKTPPAPVLSPAAEDDVPLEGSRKRSKRVSNQSSGTMTQISKKKSQSTRHNQKSKKTVPEFPSLPEESEGNGNDFSGVDDGYSEPSPNPDQHYSPTPGHDSQRVFDDACTRHKLNRRPDQQRLLTHRRLQSHSVSPLPDRQQRIVYAYGESEVFDESSPPSEKLTAEGLPKQRRRPKSSQRTFKKGTDGLASENHKEKSLQSFIKRNHSLAPKNIKTTLASFGAIFTPVSTAAKRSPSRRPLNYPNTLPPQGDYSGVSKRSSAVFNGYQHGSDYPTNEPVANFVSTKAIADICPNCPRAVHGKHSGTVPLTMDSARIPQFDELQSEVDRCKGFESGPSSMIELEKSLPSCQNIPHALSGRQMCGPPLRPITLQVEDREDLVKWLSNVWTTPDGAQIITPEHFQWYAYRGRAMGFRTDMIYETFSNGKILLGSYMTKPLQVDNNAILVFNILTSLVCITINGVKTDLTCGETFVVPCGHAYGMRNLTAEPAVLFYHRMVAEPSDLGD